MPVKNISGLLTDTSTDQAYPLGLEVEVNGTSDEGPEVWVYVKNDDASSLVAGTICARKAGTTTKKVIIAPVDTVAGRVVGVAQHTITTGKYGWIQKRGVGEVLADTGGISADTAIVVGNAVAGRADDYSAGPAAERGQIGFSTEAVAATALATCNLDCRG